MPLTHLTFLPEPRLIGSPARGSVFLPLSASVHPSPWFFGVYFKAVPTLQTSIIPYSLPLLAFTDILCHWCLSLGINLASFNQYELLSTVNLCMGARSGQKNTVGDSFRGHQCECHSVTVWSYCCLFPVDYVWNIIRGDLEWLDISHRSLLVED